MLKQEMLDIIYEKVANKKWSFGCKFYDKTDKYKHVKEIIKSMPHWWSSCWYIDNWIIKYPEICTSDIREWYFFYIYFWNIFNVENYAKIENELLNNIFTIWHPVMIWDMLDYEYKNWKSVDLAWVPFWYKKILEFWEYKRKPIDDQPEDKIERIFNLLITTEWQKMIT